MEPSVASKEIRNMNKPMEPSVAVKIVRNLLSTQTQFEKLKVDTGYAYFQDKFESYDLFGLVSAVEHQFDWLIDDENQGKLKLGEFRINHPGLPKQVYHLSEIAPLKSIIEIYVGYTGFRFKWGWILNNQTFLGMRVVIEGYQDKFTEKNWKIDIE